jgi:AcrR family transcriptional regulator
MSDATTRTGPRGGGRMSAAERREAVLAVAAEEFAAHGYAGTAVDTIARRAGITQPYVFRLFGTKKELFLAVIEHGFEAVRECFERAVAEEPDRAPLEAMGEAYARLLADRTLLLAQLQAYAACADGDVQAAVRTGFRGLVRYVEGVTDASEAQIQQFFATGMLLNVMAAMDLGAVREPWAEQLLGACGVVLGRPTG